VQSQGYSFIDFSDDKSARDSRQILADAGFKNGILYYFEALDVEEGHLQGYWSANPEPGHPIWPPTPDAHGTRWGWEYIAPGLTVEVSRLVSGSQQHYLPLTFMDAGKAQSNTFATYISELHQRMCTLPYTCICTICVTFDKCWDCRHYGFPTFLACSSNVT
jgi:hypothetical protein